jgi:hypothetical protein
MQRNLYRSPIMSATEYRAAGIAIRIIPQIIIVDFGTVRDDSRA